MNKAIQHDISDSGVAGKAMVTAYAEEHNVDAISLRVGRLGIEAARRELAFAPAVSCFWATPSKTSTISGGAGLLMSKIASIGFGPAGCTLAYALVKAGYQVTLYSDRTPESVN